MWAWYWLVLYYWVIGVVSSGAVILLVPRELNLDDNDDIGMLALIGVLWPLAILLVPIGFTYGSWCLALKYRNNRGARERERIQRSVR